jgi:hypothetical protein
MLSSNLRNNLWVWQQTFGGDNLDAKGNGVAWLDRLREGDLVKLNLSVESILVSDLISHNNLDYQ